jgi:hypothetical protein
MAASREELNGWVELPAVGLEAERELAIGGIDPGRGARGHGGVGTLGDGGKAGKGDGGGEEGE